MKLLTVILNWRTPAMSLQSAETALREMEGIDGAITIVDNDSGDGSEALLRQGVAERGWPESRVRVLQSGRNGGYGAGNNFGIRAGLPGGDKPDFVYILNSDAFPDPGAVRALLDYLARTPRCGLAGSHIHGPDGDTHQATFRFPSVASEFEGGAQLGIISRALSGKSVLLPLPETSGRVDWLAGASLMIRQPVLDRIGLFDEGYFLYFEETDLCLRALRAGFETHFVRESSVTHIGSVSTGMKEWKRVPGYWYDSRLRYFSKNYGGLTAAAATAAHVTGGAIHRLRRAVVGRRSADPPRYLRDLLVHDLKAAASAVPRPRRIEAAE
jgi:N-acetylglucosaminyl-diphospho-decaprenol L-rhamnosyltransferase